MPSTVEAATCAMFLYEGFRDFMEFYSRKCTGREPKGHADRCAMIEVRIGGAIEQAEMLAHWAEFVANETKLWIEHHGHEDYERCVDHPGVLAYEVWNPLGRWIATEIAGDLNIVAESYLGHRTVRPERVVRQELDRLLTDFFTPKGASE